MTVGSGGLVLGQGIMCWVRGSCVGSGVGFVVGRSSVKDFMSRQK